MADSSTANSTLSNPAPSAARPTDTIHDAFDAMLWFLACLIGPLRPRKITPAEEIGALAACEVETDFEPDDPPAPLLALRDLVTRAAEEHNRRALDDWHVREEAKLVRADWTPERIRETRERCERARGDTLDAIEAARVAARTDLPAALAEIERLRARPTLTEEQAETLTDMVESIESPASEGWTLPSGQNAIIKAPGGHLSIVHTSSLQRWAGKLREILSAAHGETGGPGAGDTVWTGVSVIARPAAAKEAP